MFFQKIQNSVELLFAFSINDMCVRKFKKLLFVFSTKKMLFASMIMTVKNIDVLH
jgi:hypothetical protein